MTSQYWVHPETLTTHIPAVGQGSCIPLQTVFKLVQLEHLTVDRDPAPAPAQLLPIPTYKALATPTPLWRPRFVRYTCFRAWISLYPVIQCWVHPSPTRHVHIPVLGLEHVSIHCVGTRPQDLTPHYTRLSELVQLYDFTVQLDHHPETLDDPLAFTERSKRCICYGTSYW